MKGNRQSDKKQENIFSFRKKTPFSSNNIDQTLTSENIVSMRIRNTLSQESSKLGTEKLPKKVKIVESPRFSMNDEDNHDLQNIEIDTNRQNQLIEGQQTDIGPQNQQKAQNLALLDDINGNYLIAKIRNLNIQENNVLDQQKIEKTNYLNQENQDPEGQKTNENLNAFQNNFKNKQRKTNFTQIKAPIYEYKYAKSNTMFQNRNKLDSLLQKVQLGTKINLNNQIKFITQQKKNSIQGQKLTVQQNQKFQSKYLQPLSFSPFSTRTDTINFDIQKKLKINLFNQSDLSQIKQESQDEILVNDNKLKSSLTEIKSDENAIRNCDIKNIVSEQSSLIMKNSLKIQNDGSLKLINLMSQADEQKDFYNETNTNILDFSQQNELCDVETPMTYKQNFIKIISYKNEKLKKRQTSLYLKNFQKNDHLNDRINSDLNFQNFVNKFEPKKQIFSKMNSIKQLKPFASFHEKKRKNSQIQNHSQIDNIGPLSLQQKKSQNKSPDYTDHSILNNKQASLTNQNKITSFTEIYTQNNIISQDEILKSLTIKTNQIEKNSFNILENVKSLIQFSSDDQPVHIKSIQIAENINSDQLIQYEINNDTNIFNQQNQDELKNNVKDKIQIEIEPQELKEVIHNQKFHQLTQRPTDRELRNKSINFKDIMKKRKIYDSFHYNDQTFHNHPTTLVVQKRQKNKSLKNQYVIKGNAYLNEIENQLKSQHGAVQKNGLYFKKKFYSKQRNFKESPNNNSIMNQKDNSIISQNLTKKDIHINELKMNNFNSRKQMHKIRHQNENMQKFARQFQTFSDSSKDKSVDLETYTNKQKIEEFQKKINTSKIEKQSLNKQQLLRCLSQQNNDRNTYKIKNESEVLIEKFNRLSHMIKKENNKKFKKTQSVQKQKMKKESSNEFLSQNLNQVNLFGNEQSKTFSPQISEQNIEQNIKNYPNFQEYLKISNVLSTANTCSNANYVSNRIFEKNKNYNQDFENQNVLILKNHD